MQHFVHAPVTENSNACHTKLVPRADKGQRPGP